MNGWWMAGLRVDRVEIYLYVCQIMSRVQTGKGKEQLHAASIRHFLVRIGRTPNTKVTK